MKLDKFSWVLIYHDNCRNFNNQFKMRWCCRQNNQMLRWLITRFTPSTLPSACDATFSLKYLLLTPEYALVYLRKGFRKKFGKKYGLLPNNAHIYGY